MQKVLHLNFLITRQRKLPMERGEVMNNKTVLLLSLRQVAIPTNMKNTYIYFNHRRKGFNTEHSYIKMLVSLTKLKG